MYRTGDVAKWAITSYIKQATTDLVLQCYYVPMCYRLCALMETSDNMYELYFTFPEKYKR